MFSNELITIRQFLILIFEIVNAIYLWLLRFVKCGYAGSNFPAHIFPSLVGRPIIRAKNNKIGDVEIKVTSIISYPTQIVVFKIWKWIISKIMNRHYFLIELNDWQWSFRPPIISSMQLSNGKRYCAKLGRHGGKIVFYLQPWSFLIDQFYDLIDPIL